MRGLLESRRTRGREAGEAVRAAGMVAEGSQTDGARGGGSGGEDAEVEDGVGRVVPHAHAAGGVHG